MPGDGTELHVTDVDEDGMVPNERVVMGGLEEAVFQPDEVHERLQQALDALEGVQNALRGD